MDKQNWLDLYLEYTKELESPKEFKIWTGISAVAACLGRKVWIYNSLEIYPNLFTILVGSMHTGKSSLINITKNLLPETCIHTADSVTKESILRLLQDNKSLYITQSELSIILRNNLIHTLNDFLDCPHKWKYRTKNTDLVILNDPSINILTTSIPKPISTFKNKFLYKALFIYGSKNKHKIASPKPLDNELSKILKRKLELFSKYSGKITLTDSAKKLYIDLFNSYINDATYPTTHILKVAITLAICDKSPKLIHSRHIKDADKFLKYTIKDESNK